MTETKNPNLQIVRNTDTLASCGCCGESNYTVTHQPKNPRADFTPRPDVKLWDVRVCPNGHQTWIVKLCEGCIDELRRGLGAILSEVLKEFSYTKEAK